MSDIPPALIFAVPADRPSSVLRFQRQFQHGQFTSGDEGGNGSGAGQAHVLVEGFGVGIGDDAQGAAPHPLGVGAGVIEEGTSKTMSDPVRMHPEVIEHDPLWFSGECRHSRDLPLGFPDKHLVIPEVAPCEGQFRLPLFHPRFRIAPVLLGGVGQFGENLGFHSTGAAEGPFRGSVRFSRHFRWALLVHHRDAENAEQIEVTTAQGWPFPVSSD